LLFTYPSTRFISFPTNRHTSRPLYASQATAHSCFLFYYLLMKRYSTVYEGLHVTIWTITQAQRSDVSARFHFPCFGTATTIRGPLCQMRRHQDLLDSSPLQHRCSLNPPSMPSLPTLHGKGRNCSEVFTCGNMLMEGYKIKGTRKFRLKGLSMSTTDNNSTYKTIRYYVIKNYGERRQDRPIHVAYVSTFLHKNTVLRARRPL